MKALTLVLALVSPLCAMTREEFNSRYAEKYLVAMREGLATGICAGHRGGETGMRVDLDFSSARVYQPKAFAILDPGECRGATPEPVHIGEVLRIRHLGAIHGGRVELVVENASPHAIERGVGAFVHASYEVGRAELVIPARDYDTAARILDQWVKPFKSAQEAAQYGNTASGAYVKQVKLGMTPAEVEQVMGLPDTRADLGEKVLYKYKDMTVEFKAGKVVDVR